MKRTRRGTTEPSSSRPNRQRPMTSTRRQRAAPQDHFEDTTEIEDVAPTHDSNILNMIVIIFKVQQKQLFSKVTAIPNWA
ncbi:unnamed protein product [Prunus armeniaca]